MMSLYQIFVLCGLGGIIAVLLVHAIIVARAARLPLRKRGVLEARMLLESSKIVWRLVNRGMRTITVVEVGIRCGDKIANYRPLYSQNEEVNSLPYVILPGEIGSFRNPAERFRFRPAEISTLRVSNPLIVFYVKDAEGTVYESAGTGMHLVDYLERIDRTVSTPR